MLYHERERKNKENANFVYIVYLLTKLCNIFDDAFLLTSIYISTTHNIVNEIRKRKKKCHNACK